VFKLNQFATDKVIPFLLVSSADHIAGATGLSPTFTVSKNGGAFAVESPNLFRGTLNDVA
jgi:hypothetical protein